MKSYWANRVIDLLQLMLIGLFVFIGMTVLLIISGCANTPGNMTPEQMTANAKDKNSNVACGSVSGIYGNGGTLYINVDEVARTNAKVEASATKDGCVVKVDTTTPKKD